jgi:H+-transporting ATPase
MWAIGGHCAATEELAMLDNGSKSQAVSEHMQQAMGDPAAKIAAAFRATNSSRDGLSPDEAKRRLVQYGPNALEDQTESKWHKLVSYFWGPLPFLIEAAAVISALRRDWPDFVVVTGLLLYNAAFGFWQDNKAANALAALKKGLAPRARVLRNNQWTTVDAAELVRGDVVSVVAGQIVPADLTLIDGKYLSAIRRRSPASRCRSPRRSPMRPIPAASPNKAP